MKPSSRPALVLPIAPARRASRYLLCGVVAALLVACSEPPTVPGRALGNPTPNKLSPQTEAAFAPSPAQTILPGFAKLRVSGKSVRLGANREYSWGRGVLPDSLLVDGEQAAGPMRLIATVDGVEQVVTATDFAVTANYDSHVEIRTRGQIGDAVPVTVTTRIEYDGVAQVDIALDPTRAVTVSNLRFDVSVPATPSVQMLKFEAATIRQQRKHIVFEPDYHGKFLNAVGLPDGRRSLWVFADNAEGWIWNGATVTDVETRQDRVHITQHLIGSRYVLDAPRRMKLNFLMTPVRDLGSAWRSDRVVQAIAPAHAEYGNVQMWWITAFAHQNYPYTEYQDRAKLRLPAIDKQSYPGLTKNRALLAKARAIGVDRLPYFSGHTLSGVDPQFLDNETQWQALPPYVIPPGSDRPFTAKIPRPWLSHRAAGYTDYLIERFDPLIDELGFEGLYFDQGQVIDSNNPHHGAWTDSNGVVQSSTDILAVREFYKRLAMLFHRKNKRGVIYVHNSSGTIIPAYTFVTAMVQGEEFTHHLRNLDYMASASLDVVRSKMAPGQYGVVTQWLSELWSLQLKQEPKRPRGLSSAKWMARPQLRKATRNFFALALLHDSPVISLASIEEKGAVYGFLDAFGVSDADFHGYWALGQQTPGDIVTSVYRHQRDKRALLVTANVTAQTQRRVSLVAQCALALPGKTPRRYRLSRDAAFEPVTASTALSIPGKDFRLIEVQFTD
ncbi:MAG: hypothetical protein AB8G17_14295 [Gammaproteobacteria bacterium]